MSDQVPEMVSSLADLCRAMGAIRSLLRRSLAREDEVRDLNEAVEYWMQESEAWLRSGSSDGHQGSPRRSAFPEQAMLEYLATPGVRHVEIVPSCRGRGDVQLDAATVVGLPPRLFFVMRRLAEAPALRDGWSAPVSYKDLAAALGEAFGKKFTRHAINQIVSRLRKYLYKAHVNPMLIDSSAGLRLRWRRSISASSR